MKITVNKNQQAINFKTHVGTIIMMAEDAAKRGLNRFKYRLPQNQNIQPADVINEVKATTEGTVEGYCSFKDNIISFHIIELKLCTKV